MGLLTRLLGIDRRSTAPLASLERTPVVRNQNRDHAAFAVLDVETTGLSPRSDRILEIAVVRVDANGKAVDEWTTRFNPEGPVGATHIHGITAADVIQAPVFRDLAHDMSRRFAGLPIVAHNAAFDLAFLRTEYERAGWTVPWLPAFCTLEGSRHYQPHLDRRRLADCCYAAGVRLDHAHSALGDARATAGLFATYLANQHRIPPHHDLARLLQEARAVTWPPGPAREHVRYLPGAARPLRITPTRPKGPPLAQQLAGLSLQELLDDGAPEGAISYLEMLVTVLEDGDISESEAAGLEALIDLYGLNSTDVGACHLAFVTALAHRALLDGHVSRDERAELHALATLLEVSKSTVVRLIDEADRARSARMSAGLLPLPDDWPFGDPLRVGDKVAFTGCDDAQRERLERRAEELGVRVIGGVSRLTAMLVTDGSFAGTKAAKAAELGTRVVDPDQFEVMLAHLQPAIAVTKPRTAAPESNKLSVAAATNVPLVAPASPVAIPAGGIELAVAPAVIRSWALANGFDVGVRGRLPREVIDAYLREAGLN